MPDPELLLAIGLAGPPCCDGTPWGAIPCGMACKDIGPAAATQSLCTEGIDPVAMRWVVDAPGGLVPPALCGP